VTEPKIEPEQLQRYAEAEMRDELLREFAAESDRIEGIEEPSEDHVTALRLFLALPKVELTNVRAFVKLIEPKARLRVRFGSNVFIRNGATGEVVYRPPEGGPHIAGRLEELLETINRGDLSPAEAHGAYESLHPFTDGNGRSGRAIWAWHMERIGDDPFALSFLHRYYYQALELTRRPRP
jgi:hypothetical protein